MPAGSQQLAHSRPPQATAAHARARAALLLERLSRSWLLKVTLSLGAAWILTLLPALLGRTPWTGHGWFGVAFVFAAAVVLLRVIGYVLVETLWSLRNRLLAAYLFMAVVPVVLVIAMVGIGVYLFYGQYAAFLLANEIHQRESSVDLLNDLTLREVQRFPNRSAQQEENSSNYVANYYFPRGQSANSYFFQADGKPADARAANDIGTVSPWLPNASPTLVADPYGYSIMSYRTDPKSGERVLTVYGLQPQKLDVLATPAGAKSAWAVIKLQRSPAQAARTGSPAVSSTLPLPPRRNFFDQEIIGLAFIPSYDWATGRPNKLLATIVTRPSLLDAQLFGDFSVARTGGLATVVFALGVVGAVFLLIESLSLFAGIRLTRTITVAVDDLYSGTEHVNRGDFEHRIPVHNRDQLAALEISFNDMTASISRLLEEQRQKQRLESELAIAQEVQAQLFPRTPPQVPGLEVHGRCLPARIVSGDYFDFSQLSPSQVSLALGDISGKGISAALLMATIVAAVRAYQPARMEAPQAAAAGAGGGSGAADPPLLSPASLMERVNHHLFLSTPPEKYATLFYAVYNGQRHELSYTNAGHLPPVVLGPSGARRLETGGMVVGLFDEARFDEATVPLSPGDLLAIWSDGVTEPENEYGVEFGEERLIELLASMRDRPLPDIAQLTLDAVRDWSGGQEQPDDITLVLARVTG